MKIIITGAGSFVGYHLSSKLSRDNHQVLGIDKEDNNNIKELKNLPNFTFYKLDITDSYKLSKISQGVEVIYHLAAISSERLCSENPVLAVRVNILGTLNMLEIARENNALFIFSSSGSVYPDSKHPKKEEEAVFTDKFYGMSKLMAERYCLLYHKSFNLPFVILRFSRIYGPRMVRNPIYDMSRGLAEGKTVRLYESPSSEYDFIYVEDVIKAFCQALSAKWKNKIVNISSNEAIKLQEVYKILTELKGSKVAIEVVVDKKGVDVLNNEEAKKLGWFPDYSLRDGLIETLRYFEEFG